MQKNAYATLWRAEVMTSRCHGVVGADSKLTVALPGRPLPMATHFSYLNYDIKMNPHFSPHDRLGNPRYPTTKSHLGNLCHNVFKEAYSTDK